MEEKQVRQETTYEEKIIRGGQYGVLLLILAVVLLAVGALAFAGGCIFAVEADDVRGVALIAVGAAAFIAGVIIACGLKVVKPNEALVLTLFGKYLSPFRPG